MIQTLLIESQTLTRLGIKTVLAGTADVELVGEADNAADGLKLFDELRPDVTILGLSFQDSCTHHDHDK